MNEYNDMHRTMIESNNLGILFCRQGSYQMSVMFHLQALKIAESIMGKFSKDYCDSLYNLGNTCAEAGDYDIALKYLFAAEKNAVMRGASSDMDMVHLLNSIAYVMEESEDYPGAIMHLESALAKLRRIAVSGGENEDLLRNIYYLGGICEKAKDFHKARLHYSEALSIIRRSKTQYYPTCLNNLANVLTELGDLEKALELRVEATDQIKSIIGPKSISYAQSIRNLAVIYRGHGDYQKAIELLNEAIEIKSAILGANSKETIRETLLQIEFYAAAKETDRALDTFIRLLDELDSEPDEHDDILQELAKLYMHLGDINQLNELYNKAVEIARARRDDEDEWN